MIELLVGLAAMTMTVGVPVGLIVLAHDTEKRMRAQRAAALAALAQQLGLVSGGGELVHGRVRGVPVRVWFETRGSDKNRVPYTVLEARFEPPLDLGLVVKRSGALGSLWSQLTGAQDHVLGDPRFDAAFVVRGDEPQRIAALLDPALRVELVGLLCDVELTDIGVRFDVRGHRADRQVAALLDVAARIAVFITDRRHRIPPARALAEHVFAWQRAAASLGFTFFSSPLAVMGELEGGQVSAYASRVAPFHFVTRVSAAFARPLPFQLAVRPTVSMAFDFFAERDDVRIGDDAFDKRFYVRSDRPDLATRALGADASAHILALAERGRVEIDSFGLTLTLANLGPAGALVALLQGARAAADAVYAATDAAPRRLGAYR